MWKTSFTVLSDEVFMSANIGPDLYNTDEMVDEMTEDLRDDDRMVELPLSQAKDGFSTIDKMVGTAAGNGNDFDITEKIIEALEMPSAN